MVESKRSNTWCVPSFDCESVNKPSMKRSAEPNDGTLLDRSFTQSNFKRRKRNETSLSKLLLACEPQSLSELAVSKKKQNEISNWLQDRVLEGQPSMLILSGPSGCGKTVAVKLLAKENGFNVIEWITPIDPAEDENKYVMRQGDRFEDYLIRATRYHSVLGDCSKQLLLIKDLPNVYHEDCNSFLTLLEKYFQLGREPVIFVYTDTSNWKLKTLFPPHIIEEFCIDHINVFAATHAAMKTVLNRVSKTLNAISGDMLRVSQRHIEEILSNSIGDVRSAVLNLIFVSLRVPEGCLKSECGIREETLSLPHGVGRVINPKKVPHGDSFKFVHDPEEIAAFFQSLSVTFVQFLQENYLKTIRTIEEATVASDILSLSDVLNSDWSDRKDLSKVALSYCIRGLMVANEKPVSNWNPTKKPPDNHTNIRRCLVTAETRYYESIIKKSTSKETNKVLEENEETFIEED
ncbi:cell cycle checkpoint protein RAD17 [Monomorium pharaonis]|uniref:cell cycle checkpoint protein RAD17 n=1 Tax=Monomorium pharaonis TaxID=307658 RepID=UPI001747BC3B|nr:cell cycle checkpoint protein RAD17 [Monomorium pharaonis]